MLRALLLDFNGVLVDDEGIRARVLSRVAAEEEIEIASDRMRELCSGRHDRPALVAVFAEAGRELPESLLLRLTARTAMYLRQAKASEAVRPSPGIQELIEDALARGLVLGVVTARPRAEVEAVLDRLGLRRAFKVVVSADDGIAPKPDPEGYRRALRELNGQPPLPERLFHPHEVVAIEDSPAGIEAAAGAGLWTIGLATTQPPEALGAADRVVESAVGLSVDRLSGEME